MRNATTLVDAGFVVTIVDVESRRTPAFQDHVHGLRLEHILLPNWLMETRSPLWLLFKELLLIVSGTLRLVRTKADIYHASVGRALPACYIAARLQGKPLVFDAPQLPLSTPPQQPWRQLWQFSIRTMAIMLQHCAGIITLSPLVGEEIRKVYHVHKVTVVRDVPSYYIVGKSERLRTYLNQDPSKRLVVYQGSLRILLRLVPLLEPNIVLVVMSESSSEAGRQLAIFFAQEGMTERVKIVPAASYAEMLEWATSADIGLLLSMPDYTPSVQMTLSSRLFEYLMAGLPVLSSPFGATRDILETHMVGRTFSSLEPTHIAQEISALLADPVLLARMRQNALEISHSELYWEKECRQLLRLYADTLRAKS